jgi:hypothetical protein
VNDLDAHDAALAGLRQHPSRFEAGDAQLGADLVLRLVLLVIELRDAHGQQLFVHASRVSRLQLMCKPVLI